jgi:integrase
MAVPTITIFTRHAESCQYRSDESYRRCQCRKSLRWFRDGRQYKKSANTRSWAAAEEVRRKLEEQFQAGKAAPTVTENRKTVSRAIELFLLEKETGGDCSEGVLNKYRRELDRFKTFAEGRSKFFPSDVDKELLLDYRASWKALYPSSATRQQVQARLRGFLRFCYDDRLMEKLPKLSAIEVDEPPTLPLTAKEYALLLETVGMHFEGSKAAKVRALIQFMRHSSLAIRDAVTVERSELSYDAKKKFYRVATARQKTGVSVSVPLPREIAGEVLAVVNDSPKYFFWNGKGMETSAVTNWQHDLRTVFRAAFGQDTNFTPHCLRDTAAVEWLSAGIPLEEVSKLLGHTSVKTTEKSYSPWVTIRQDRLDTLVVNTWN